jgi:Tol biopolymer transport system component
VPRTAVLAAALLLAVVSGAAAARPAAAQDSDAPPDALPHWLPTEMWVYQHWLPFDEGRLYAVLGADRGRIWRHLRNDAEHDLAQLARRRGLTVRQAAVRLVGSRRLGGTVGRTQRIARAERTLTQGHLSQHLLFHSLHQTAIPRRARTIFGVASREEFTALRRAELSPLQIGRLNGRTQRQIAADAARALREYARRGVRNGSFSRRQADLLLDRQLRQLPRWLGQTRYNGPPRTLPGARAELPAADFANNPSITADGSSVVFDAYRATIPEARAAGEIHVMRHAVADGRLERLDTSTGTVSSYNAAVAAGGGRVVYEQAAGNFNFAKRYGQMNVLVTDIAGGLASQNASHAAAELRGRARTAYNPSISADGRHVAFEATDDGAGGRSRNGLWVRDLRTGRARLVGAGSGYGAVYEPRIAGDGRSVVFTAGDAAADGHTLVYLRELTGARRTVLVSRGARPADADAHEPAVSHDGRFVAFTSRAGNLGGGARGVVRLYLRDVAAGTTRALTRDGAAFDPAISPDGRWVAFAHRTTADPLRSQIRLVDVSSGAERVLWSGDGYASEPAVSGDGTRVAWSSTAAEGKPGGIPGVFLADLAEDTVRLLSTHAPLAAAKPAAPRARASRAAHGGRLCPLST